jgi:hypothetical protein
MKATLLKFFLYLGINNEDDQISITNCTVLVFCGICAFRSFFPGLVIKTMYFTWTVQSMDVAGTLPMLFSLLNYGHKRTVAAALPTKPSTPSQTQGS